MNMRCRALLLSLMLLLGCRSQTGDFVPNVLVDVVININLPSYQALNVVGGLHFFDPAGYRGLVIYRQSIDEFVVFDRACTYQPSEPCHVVSLDSATFLMACACCDSRFSLDGFVANPPAVLSLKPYRTLFSPNSNTLRITN